MPEIIITDMRDNSTLTFAGALTPRQALVAAHGFRLRDGNTWEHEARYGALVEQGSHHLFLGDLAVRTTAPARPCPRT